MVRGRKSNTIEEKESSNGELRNKTAKEREDGERYVNGGTESKPEVQ